MTPRCDNCGKPLTIEPEGERWCVWCSPVTDEFHKEAYEYITGTTGQQCD